MMWHRKLGSIYFAVLDTGKSQFMLSLSEAQLGLFKACRTVKEYERLTSCRAYYQYDYGRVKRMADGLWYKDVDILKGKVCIDIEPVILAGGLSIGLTENQMDRRKDGDDIVPVQITYGTDIVTEMVSFKWFTSVLLAASRYDLCVDRVMRSEARARRQSKPRGKVGLGFEIDYLLDYNTLEREVSETDIMNQALC